MVEVLVGDILRSKAQTLINTVNCVGVMGKGIALNFKKAFPDMYKDYVKRCARGEVKLGRPYIYRTLQTPWIINFPTKDHWRSVASLNDIECGMQYLLDHYRDWGVTSLAVPPLGCGEGQLEWRIVGPTMYRYLTKMDIPVELYAPFGTPDMETQGSFLANSSEPIIADAGSGKFKVKPDWVAIVEILARIEREPYHWSIGRTTLQKIAYFATEAGLNTELEYQQGSFGPFAPSLKSKITQLVNNGLIREERRGQMFRVMTGSTYSDARKSYSSTLDNRDNIIDRVANLFLRMKTRQAEIAATVHYSAKRLMDLNGRKPTENQVLAYVMDWKQRRTPPLSKLDVALSIRNLGALGWLNVTASNDLPIPEADACEV